MQLGLSSTGIAVPKAAFRAGTGLIGWTKVACTGAETALHDCPYQTGSGGW